MNAVLKVRLLGGLALVWVGKPLDSVHSPRLQSLLGYLLLHCDTPQSRQHLAFLFFPDSNEAQARTNLRNLLHLLHHALPKADLFLDGDAQSVRWRADAPYTLDVTAFETALRTASRPEDWKAAVELYGGDLLPGCYDDWVLPAREQLRLLYLDALEHACRDCENARDTLAARKYAQLLLTTDPLREETYRRLMRLASAQGDRAGVARFYNQCVNVLARELSVEPSAETLAAYQAALQGTANPRAESGLEQKRSHNLPLQLTGLIGRTEDVRALSDAVMKHRLVTLVGAGGVGKTRLALAGAADLLNEFAGGVWFVDLATLSDGAMVAQAVATALHVRETSGAALIEILANSLRDKQLLLVLDNCEHLVESVRRITRQLLYAAPELHVLATSRQALSMDGEFVWHTLPLRVPEPRDSCSVAELMQSPSVQLFVERATTAFSAFGLTDENASAVANICRRLDGIPLAIELAAARVSLLTAPEIAERLDDIFHLLARGAANDQRHHQTMRAALDWSYDTLAEPERILFRRLAVFAGGFTLEAAEAVCADTQDGSRELEITKTDILDLIAKLIDRSLVSTFSDDHKPRLRLLEPTRLYAREKLSEAGETARMGTRHLEYFLALAQQVQPHLQTRDQKAWLARLEQDHTNFLAALEWSQLHEASRDRGLALCLALVEFWIRTGLLREGQYWLTTALANAPAQDAARAKALSGLGTLLYMQGHLEQAAEYHAQALALFRERDDKPGIIISLSNLGVQKYRQNRYAEAEIFFRESLELAREAKSILGMQRALHCLGGCAMNQGDLKQAQELCMQALELAQHEEDKRELVYISWSLGGIAKLAGDYASSAKWYQEGLALAQDLKDKWAEVHGLISLGAVRQQQGNFVEAAALDKKSLQVAIQVASPLRIAECIETLAALALAQDNPLRAARLYGAGEALRHQIRVPVETIDSPEYEQAITRTRTKLQDSDFTAAWAAGHAMSETEAIAYALRDD